jgi:predicted acyltransferase
VKVGAGAVADRIGSDASNLQASTLNPQRLVSLDVFRGLTIAGMLVVNTPGTWDYVFPSLLHAPWHGWTYTDTIFPFFLFIVGASMAFSFAKRLACGASRRALLLHCLRRGAMIFALGLALNVLSFFLFQRAQVRIPGVLQRIGVCFLLAALLYLFFGRKGLLPAAALLLSLYWALMTLVPVPGYGAGRLDVEGNLAASVDRAVLGAHTWKHDPGWDPEGILSTIPAVATVLLGIAAGDLLRSRRDRTGTLVALMAAGAIASTLGLLWGIAFPINKNLWTSSYALFMGGLSAVLLALCIWVVDVKGWRGWSKSFLWLGANAIAIFVLSTLGTLILLAIKLKGPDGVRRSLYGTIYRAVFDRFADPRLSSLLFALANLALWLAVAGLLYRRRIFIRI